MRLVEISKNEFDSFGINNKIRNFYQTSEYGTWMENRGYKCIYLGYKDYNNLMHAATLVIHKPVFANYKYGYAPRGFLINYNDTDLLKSFTTDIKQYLNKNGFAYLKIDPPIIYKSRDKKGNYKGNRNSEQLMKKFKDLGYEHQGFNTNFEGLKPRWNAVIPLDKPFNEIKRSFNKEIKNKINSAKRKGLEVYIGNEEDINILYEFIKNKYDRPISYYNDYYKIFKKRDMIDIYMVKLDIYNFLEQSQKLYDKELSKNEEIIFNMQGGNNSKSLINKKINSDKNLASYKKNINTANNMLREKKKEMIIGGAIIIKYNKQTQILIDGFSEKYKGFNPNHILKEKIIKDAVKRKDYYVDLNGIVGNFKKEDNKFYGLNKFKLGFSSEVVEYLGEFNLAINPIIYEIVKKASGIGLVHNIGTNKK